MALKLSHLSKCYVYQHGARMGSAQLKDVKLATSCQLILKNGSQHNGNMVHKIPRQ